MRIRGRRHVDSGAVWGIPQPEPAAPGAETANPPPAPPSQDPWGSEAVSLDPLPVPPPPGVAAAHGSTLTIPAPPMVVTLPAPPAPPADEIRLDPPGADQAWSYPDVSDPEPVAVASPWGIPAPAGPHADPADAFAHPGRRGSAAKGLALGAVTALAAAALWAAVVLVSNWQLGIVAIAVGLLVAGAVRVGSGQRPGALPRGGAMALTLAAMVLAHLVITRAQVVSHHVAESGEAIAPVAEVLARSVDSLLAQPLTLVFWAIAVFNAWWFAAPAPREPIQPTAQAAA